MTRLEGPLTWVVGGGGLLGRSIVERYSRLGGASLWTPEEPITWDDEERAKSELHDAASVCLGLARSLGVGWRILWCAGAGVVATGAEVLEAETRAFASFLESVESALGTLPALPGVIFHASSAGAVYGGSADRPPYGERSALGSRSVYGTEKLLQEGLARSFALRTGVRLLIGRISNLYGPGQNSAKPQGLVTQIGRAALRREPIHIYVPLSTIRDYIFAADAADLVCRSVERLEREPVIPLDGVVKIVASEVGTTIAAVIAVWRSVLKRAPRLVLASSPVAQLQPLALSFHSEVWPDIRAVPTSLPVGISAVLRSQLADLRSGRL